MTEFTLTKRDGQLEMSGLLALLTHLQSMPDGDYRVPLARRRGNRTGRQNNWLWGVLYPALRCALVDQGWEFTDDEQVHEFFMGLLCRRTVINRHTGETVTFPDSSAQMDTAQFSAYCDSLLDYARDYLGMDTSVLLPKTDPSRNGRKQ